MFCFIFLHNRHRNILQKIFIDYYEEIKYTLHPRSYEMENIEKMINCGDPASFSFPFCCQRYFPYVLQNKSKNFTPGYIMLLHTFGRDLKWNPHIHCLIFEGGYSDDGFWRHITHFNYTYLRNAFHTALLNEMERRLGPSFKKLKALCYSEHKQGFYVYA